MAYIKININRDERTAKLILGQFKALVNNSKTELDINYNKKSGLLEDSTISGVLGDSKFKLTATYEGGVGRKYNLKVGDYEVDFDENFRYDLTEGKFTRVAVVLQNRVRQEYLFDENTQTYLKRPKQPNIFQRIFSRNKEM